MSSAIIGRSLHTCHEKHVQESKLYNADETQAGSWDRTHTDTHFHHIKCAQGENWQSVWAEGLGSFASGKECGSSACPAFIHTSWRTFEAIQCTLWYRTLGLKGMQCERTMLWNWKFGLKVMLVLEVHSCSILQHRRAEVWNTRATTKCSHA